MFNSFSTRSRTSSMFNSRQLLFEGGPLFLILPLWLLDNTPNPTITKHEWFEFFYTEERVQLHCNMPGVGWEYQWYKDSKLQTTNPELIIDSVSRTDTGDYHCKAQRGEFSVDSETLQVRVEGKLCPYKLPHVAISFIGYNHGSELNKFKTISWHVKETVHPK